ncbi:MAG: TetR family transcriptional regulator [Microbacteriaceae bacterium]|jgi:TetR/AcrR family transcriptional regulator|nr:TetR family transcriptional regulator [Microbacteriaceae bacterium]
MSSQIEIRTVALSEFATAGYSATSIQRIAELAGLSKSSVLYHYASKEALLEVAISPALERMGAILDRTQARGFSDENRNAFIVEFVGFLLEHRLEVHMFINQGTSLEEVPVIARANRLVYRLRDYFCPPESTTEDRMRFAMALGGAAFTLVTRETYGQAALETDQVKAALVTIVTELLTPVTVRPIPVQE